MSSPERPVSVKIIWAVLVSVLNFDLFLGPYQYIRAHDELYYYPVNLMLLGEHIFKQGFSSWDPTWLGGVATYSIPYSALHPLAWMTQVLPLWLVFALFVWGIFYFAAHGMYLYLRRVSHLTERASVFGGCLFAFLLYIYSRKVASPLVYLYPLVLYLSDSFYERDLKGKILSFAAVMGIFSLTTFATSIPFFPVAQFFMILVCSRPWIKFRRDFLLFVCVWGGYMVMHAPDIYSVLMELPQSHRLGFTSSRGFTIPTTVLVPTFLQKLASLSTGPDLYFRIIPMALSVCSLFFIRNRQVFYWWSYGVLAVGFAFFMRSSFGVAFVKTWGLFKTHEFTRFEFLAAIVVAALASHGVHFYERLRERESTGEALLPGLTSKKSYGALYFAVLSGFIFLATLQCAVRPSQSLFLKTIFFVYVPLMFLGIPLLFKRATGKAGRTIRVVGWLVCFLYGFGYATVDLMGNRGGDKGSFHFFFHNPSADRTRSEFAESLRSQGTLFRAAMAGTGHPSYLTFHGLETADGLANVYSGRYSRYFAKVLEPLFRAYPKIESSYYDGNTKSYLWQQMQQTEFERRTHRLEMPSFNSSMLCLANVKYIFSRYLIEEPEKFGLRLAYRPEATGTEDLRDGWRLRAHFLAVAEDFSLGRLTEAISTFLTFWFRSHAPFWIYELPGVLPRAFGVRDWTAFKTEGEALDFISRMKPEAMRAKGIFVESDLPVPIPPRNALGPFEARITRYEWDRVVVEGSASPEGILVLTNTYNSGWKAFVNGKETRVFPAYSAFMAVAVPAGAFVIEFQHENSLFLFMFAATFIGFGGFFLAAFFLLVYGIIKSKRVGDTSMKRS